MVFAISHLWRRNLESIRIGPFWPRGLMPTTPMVMSRLVALSLTFSCRVLLGLICRFGFVCVLSSVDSWTVGRLPMSNICMFWNAVLVTWLGRAGIYWIPGRIAIAWFSLSILSIGIISTRQIWQSVFLCNRWASAIDLLYSCVSPVNFERIWNSRFAPIHFPTIDFLCLSLSIGWMLCLCWARISIPFYMRGSSVYC